MRLALSAAIAAGCAAPPLNVPAVPESLHPPAGQVQYRELLGSGVQVYVCRADAADPGRFEWILKEPQADLRDARGRVVGRHYAGPTWESSDGSKVVGEVRAKEPAPEAGAIPWLLLRAKSTAGSGVFGSIASIQRIATHGGSAPPGVCRAGTEIRVPYRAIYRFYDAGP